MEKNNFESCPRCGHHYFHSGSGLCKWCVNEIDSEKNPKPIESGYSEDQDKWHDNCIGNIKSSISEEDRKKLASKLGPNWACIISGLGDQ